MSKYSKRTKSTKSKSYSDYIAMRAELEYKGYELKPIMDKDSFDEYYKRLQDANKSGEIKSGAWQELKSKERLVNRNQARKLAMAASDYETEKARALDPKAKKVKITQQDIYKVDYDKIEEYGDYLNKHKKSGLYGGKYE